MQSGDSTISHVSDTALMVAAARALETERPDGLTRDPFAKRLAGERGMSILAGLDGAPMLCFGIGIRSAFLDELLLEAIAKDEIDSVLLLGAGLDSRPFRLQLPESLRWIEVDFQDMLDYKYARLHESPNCRLQRITADLNEPAGREVAFAGAGERTLLITEGLLMYLAADTVDAIAAAATKAGVRRWLMDLTSTGFSKSISSKSLQSVENVRAATCLDGLQTREVLHRYGWSSLRHRSYLHDVMPLAGPRVTAMIEKRTAMGLAAPTPPPPDDPSGVHLFAR